MQSFFDHVPERYHATLRKAIEAVTETKILLDQVAERFGTREPEGLRERMGRTFEGIVVTPEAVQELEALVAEHEARRRACQHLMARAARGESLSDGDAPAPRAE